MKTRPLPFARLLSHAGGVASDALQPNYVLSLFISGITPKSTMAVTTIKRICEARLQGRYTLEIIDIYQQPQLARAQQIIAAPTLIKSAPLPVRRLIGDMSNEARVLSGLELA